MVMAGDLEFRLLQRLRQMAKGDGAQRNFRGDAARKLFRQHGIVIAGQPADVHRLAQPAQAVEVCGIDPLAGALVMKAVAERNQARRLKPFHHPLQPREGRARIVGRDAKTASDKTRALLQMEVGHEQRTIIMDKKRAGEIGLEIKPAKGQARTSTEAQNRQPRG
jgi:hypothetical protein